MMKRVYKLFAAWLIVLGLCPFTAPFATCELAAPFGESGTLQDNLVKPVISGDDALAPPAFAAFDTPLVLAGLAHASLIVETPVKQSATSSILRI